MDVDDSSESRMSLDSLDHVYLGPDEELDSDSGSSRGPDVLDAIPGMFSIQPFNISLCILIKHFQIHHFLLRRMTFALFNDPDLYLGPEDDLIECDDAPAVPDSPMTATKSTPEPPSVHPVVSEAPLSSHATTPGRQSTQPDLTNEELRAMIQEFMPIGSYDQTEIQSIIDRLGDYQQRQGHIPHPTVAQLLEADRPFRMAWAETSDKLRRADMDLRRMQRVRQSTSEMLVVLDRLIESYDED
ncbi:hypothetical protein F4604DRAFT_1926002 [Suillus subluteus]|nr:hypothetical protein F4604DRAFT_1926002 [Suillus subluteus]